MWSALFVILCLTLLVILYDYILFFALIKIVDESDKISLFNIYDYILSVCFSVSNIQGILPFVVSTDGDQTLIQTKIEDFLSHEGATKH